MTPVQREIYKNLFDLAIKVDKPPQKILIISTPEGRQIKKGLFYDLWKKGTINKNCTTGTIDGFRPSMIIIDDIEKE